MYCGLNGSNQKRAEQTTGQTTGDQTMTKLFARFANDESGATAIEYGLIAAIVGVGIISGLTTLKGGLNGLFSRVNTNLAN